MSSKIRKFARTFALCASVVMAAAGCGTTTTNTAAAGNAADKSRASGVASVAYAGSLQLVNDQVVGPAFTRATGISYQGRGGGSYAVAQLIAGHEITPNVFMSIGTGPVKVINPAFTTWAVGFASSPLVIAYSPESPYARQMEAIAKGKAPLSTLFTLMAQPTFHLGRTDPNTDPQGQYFILMLHLAEQALKLPAGTADKILGGVNNPREIFDEQTILSRLQAGQLDASSAYLPEAVQRHLPYIQLPDTVNLGNPADAATYAKQSLRLSNGKVVTGAPIEVYITALKGTPATAAGEAFVRFILSPQGQQLYKQAGYTLTPPIVYGQKRDIPSSILGELGQVQ
ncbi:tungstate ABC transporter substrate-binding protein WtpA [Alicyclobacillus contaminans]|uniref:extracellular solute-binding protein n=1 Tax=Alicyclobacillus contaminans TaxID=392016 RepID=UPI00040D042A|nr:extracellular solute-binding protein [Alicyclobacillus contaminans]GMA49941.1 tungstate ABC transporter substrate-binding protein WtpA [Alicyclobacillus contaminans]